MPQAPWNMDFRMLRMGEECTGMAANSPKPLPHWGVCSLSSLHSKPPPSNNHTLLLPPALEDSSLCPPRGSATALRIAWPASPTATRPKSPKTHQCLRLTQNPIGQDFKFPKLYLLPKDGAAEPPRPIPQSFLQSVYHTVMEFLVVLMVDYKYLLHTLACSGFSLGI